MTPKQKLVKIFNKHDYTEEHNRYISAHTSSPDYFPSFKDWLIFHESAYNILKKAIEEAGYKNPLSDRTWITAAQVYAQVGALKNN